MTSTLYLMVCNVQPTNGVCPAANQVWMSWTDVTSFDVSQLDPVLVAQALAAGFVLVGMFWAIGKACKVLLDMVRHG
ncbi:MAG TPA: hypothetical protein VJR90_05185 [Gammaproteobacteria bacterium]|nr:hypothetical protein [Gammaproteobacteria bacterium]